ncbi:hypothetical protein BOTCAL_0013g00020 [Botryotinia calthae]|uniref:Uncharacterized protein n=1 Tax=Botryotinia calthae TaxID=38488 RepID=A0A4Y8DFT3_9HELO|nr:hypothetical protein BOTCAL_0013g00020 [Botryotinia calthae]
MNPNHVQDLPLDLKSLSIIIHYDTSFSTDLRKTADLGQQDTTMLRNSHDSSTENVQNLKQDSITQNELDASISCSEEKLDFNDMSQVHKQEAQLYEPKEWSTYTYLQEPSKSMKEEFHAQAQLEGLQAHQQSEQVYKQLDAQLLEKNSDISELTESAKKELLAQAQMEVGQSKSEKMDVAGIQLPSKDATIEQTEKLQQIIQGYFINNPLQTHRQVATVYKYFAIGELKKGTYPEALSEQVKKRLQVKAQVYVLQSIKNKFQQIAVHTTRLDSMPRLAKLLPSCIAAYERGCSHDV